MIFFILFLILSVVFIKLGALSVWVHLLAGAFKFALLLIGGLMLTLVSILWSKRAKINQYGRHNQ